MAKKWTLIAGVGALVIVAIAAVALLGSRKAPSSAVTGTTTVGLSGSTGSSAASATPSTVSSGTTSTTAAGGNASPSKTPSSGTAPAKPGAAQLATLKPFPPMPASTLPAQEAKEPAAKGAVLPPLTAAPDKTISALKLGQAPDGAIYRVTLRPYGFGPSSTFGTRIAVRVDAAQPLGSAPNLASIVNANILVVIDTTKGGAITAGGTYAANLQFRSDGAKLLPILSGVSAK